MKKANPVSGLSLYACVFLDIAAWDGDLDRSLTRDILWLERLVISRGVSFTMIDMPEAGKVLDLALSRGRIFVEDLPKTFGRTRKGYREFLSGLFSKVFDEEGRLRDDVSTTAIRFLRQVLYLAKKVEKECSDAAILAEVQAFKQTDIALRSPSLDWDGDRLVFPDERLCLLDGLRVQADWFSYRDTVETPLLRYIQATADNLISRFPGFDWRELRPKHGPGAVADARTGTDKYLFPTWPAKLEAEFPKLYFGCASEEPHLLEESPSSPKEVPVRLLAVPKTLKGPRMIASEPIAHQYIQLGMMRWFRQHLPKPLRSCIDFQHQEPSRRLCLEASVDGDLATVDLSAASDRLSCWLVERIFRSNPSILIALHACRSRWLYNATGVGEPYFLKLRKYAPMGNGTTFPVQSIVYAIICIACMLYESRVWPSDSAIRQVSKKLRVFGDDIILPSPVVSTLVRALDHLDLKVNRMKTHSTGHFRESCGMDAFKGVDVTPLYLHDFELRDTPAGLVSWTDVLKNAGSRGLPTLSAHMSDLIPGKWRSLLPHSSKNLGCLTLWSYFDGTFGGKRRYNRRLHRWEVLGLIPSTRQIRRKRETHANLLQYWTDSPEPDSNWTSGYVVRVRTLLKKGWVPV